MLAARGESVVVVVGWTAVRVVRLVCLVGIVGVVRVTVTHVVVDAYEYGYYRKYVWYVRLVDVVVDALCVPWSLVACVLCLTVTLDALVVGEFVRSARCG